MRVLTSIFMIGLAGYIAMKNRYRILNILLGTGFMRRLFVGSLMKIPGVRNAMIQTVFSRPAEQ
jgi:hypothetical protein